MNRYRVSIIRFGRALVDAESKEAAVRKSQELANDEIYWLSQKDGLDGNYVITLAELDKKGE